MKNFFKKIYAQYREGELRASRYPFSVFGFMGERIKNKNPEDVQCPVCGFYCLGKGGFGCIDKPSLFAHENVNKTPP